MSNHPIEKVLVVADEHESALLSQEELEEFLLGQEGALMLVSHDQYFLNRMVTHIVELEEGALDLFVGDYDCYVGEKEQRLAALQAAARVKEKEREKAERFVRRFRAKNTKARQVQQKIRQLEKICLLYTSDAADDLTRVDL